MSVTRRYTSRQIIGAVLLDLPRLIVGLRAAGENPARATWLRVRNRHEALEFGPEMDGVKCLWDWTSRLHVTSVFPEVGRLLMRRALDHWPISMTRKPPAASSTPHVSFVIGHRGRARSQHLMTTLQNIAAQEGVDVECVVVEQATEPEIERELPAWVRYVHQPPPTESMPYCRSWAFNVGAAASSGEVLIFHDNDMLVPARYAAEIYKRFLEGWEVVNVKRFVFYLDQSSSQGVFEGRIRITESAPDHVVQNLEAGGSVACARSAFLDIGRWDESFVGWGGEDNEFWERAEVTRRWVWGYMPIVHLWHAPQPEKVMQERDTSGLYLQRRLIAARDRIDELQARRQGHPEGPWALNPGE